MNFFLPFIIMLLCIFVARIVNEKSLKLLTAEQKSELIDIFSKHRIYGFAFIIILIAVLFLFPYFNILNLSNTLVIYITGFVGYFLVSSIISYKKLKQNNYQSEFIKYYLLSTVLRFAGIALFFVFFIILRNVN